MKWNGTTYTVEVMYMIAMQTLLHVTTIELNSSRQGTVLY